MADSGHRTKPRAAFTTDDIPQDVRLRLGFGFVMQEGSERERAEERVRVEAELGFMDEREVLAQDLYEGARQSGEDVRA